MGVRYIQSVSQTKVGSFVIDYLFDYVIGYVIG